MNEIQIREILERYDYLQNLHKRRKEILEAINEKGKLTDELEKAILLATTLKELEDLYAPYKSKRRPKLILPLKMGSCPLQNLSSMKNL